MDKPTIADLFEAAGYGRPGNDIDEYILWLFVERQWLEDEMMEEFWDNERLRVRFGRRVDRLRGAALRYRRDAAWWKRTHANDAGGLVEKVSGLKALLRRVGRHPGTCPAFNCTPAPDKHNCNCGLDEALK